MDEPNTNSFTGKVNSFFVRMTWPSAESRADIIVSGAPGCTKKTSFAAGFHAGAEPPFVEMAMASPGPGYGRTYTSFRPVVPDANAIHRWSGDHIGETSGKAPYSLRRGLIRYPEGRNCRGGVDRRVS